MKRFLVKNLSGLLLLHSGLYYYSAVFDCSKRGTEKGSSGRRRPRHGNKAQPWKQGFKKSRTPASCGGLVPRGRVVKWAQNPIVLFAKLRSPFQNQIVLFAKLRKSQFHKLRKLRKLRNRNCDFCENCEFLFEEMS